MKPITLRGVSPALESALKKASSEAGVSLNRAAIALLERGAGLDRRRRPALHHDLDELAGAWSAQEAEEFDRDLASRRRVDAELWK